METIRSKKVVDSFVSNMAECIWFYAKGRIPESEMRYMSEYEVNRLDFNDDWQMHKGLGYFARNAVNRYLEQKEAYNAQNA